MWIQILGTISYHLHVLYLSTEQIYFRDNVPDLCTGCVWKWTGIVIGYSVHWKSSPEFWHRLQEQIMNPNPYMKLLAVCVSTHTEVALVLWLLNPADCLLSRLLMFSAEYGLFGRGGALSHLRCSRSAIVPATCRHEHQLHTNRSD